MEAQLGPPSTATHKALYRMWAKHAHSCCLPLHVGHSWPQAARFWQQLPVNWGLEKTTKTYMVATCFPGRRLRLLCPQYDAERK